MREIGLSDVRLASPPCFPLSWETDNVSVHLSADYPVIWHQCHSLSQHNTLLGPLAPAWAIYGLFSSPNCKIHSPFFHHLLSISIHNLFLLSSPAKGIKQTKICSSFLPIILLSSRIIIKCTPVLNTMNGIISCACGGFLFLNVKSTDWGLWLNPEQCSCIIVENTEHHLLTDGKLFGDGSTSKLIKYAHHFVLGLNAVNVNVYVNCYEQWPNNLELSLQTIKKETLIQ